MSTTDCECAGAVALGREGVGVPAIDAEAERFLQRLAAVEIGGTFNQYRDWIPGLDGGPGAPARRLANLREHLAVRQDCCEMLLVGEAPGHLGCRFTGVAFASERQLPLERRTSLHPTGWAESSATIVASTLRSLELDVTTVRWNAVPTHPHRPGEPRSNRPPTADEVNEGRALLGDMIGLLKPALVVAVGQVAGRMLPDAICVRHPARGGASAFRAGLAALFPSPPISRASIDALAGGRTTCAAHRASR